MSREVDCVRDDVVCAAGMKHQFVYVQATVDDSVAPHCRVSGGSGTHNNCFRRRCYGEWKTASFASLKLVKRRRRTHRRSKLRSEATKTERPEIG